MINQYLQDPVVPPTDIRNVSLQPELCPYLLYPSSNINTSIRESKYPFKIWSYSNCYSFHDKIFKNAKEANAFCKNAFGKSEEYTGELAFGHFPHHENEKLPGKSQIWSYAKPGFLHDIESRALPDVCSCQSSHNNTFIKLKDSSVCPKAKDSQISDLKVCPSEFNIRTVCALVKGKGTRFLKRRPNMQPMPH